jgi:hypothetical protein
MGVRVFIEEYSNLDAIAAYPTWRPSAGRMQSAIYDDERQAA